MNLDDVVDQSWLVAFCQSHGIAYLAVFGSMARGDASATSDVDLLVRFRVRVSLIQHVQIQQELEEAIGRKVDLISIDSLHPRLKDRILNSQRVIYDEAV